jgi:NAD(P)-dependent dehydrogenase (short-subunit alcohol dehydrogenase family)
MIRSAVVTGASTGIGRASVAELVRAGWHVWAAVRTAEDEASLLAEHPSGVDVLRLDLTDGASIEAAGARVRAAGPLHGLVNNAGAALAAPLEYLPVDVFRRQLEINVVGQLAVTQAMLPALHAARSRGEDARVVMIGSIGGRIASPIVGPYHTSKFAMVGLADSLRAELAPFGIRVVLIEPGSIATPIWAKSTATANDILSDLPPEASRYAAQIAAARQRAADTAARGIPPERAARRIVTALTTARPRPRQLVGRDATAAALLVRLLPHALIYRLTASRPSSPSSPDSTARANPAAADGPVAPVSTDGPVVTDGAAGVVGGSGVDGGPVSR